MPLFIISIIIQVAFLLHVIKTGRDTRWLYIILLLPVAGAIVYFIVEVWPDLAGSRTGRKAKKKVSEVLQPNKDLNQALEDYSTTDTVENALKLGNECLTKNMYAEAKQLFSQCLTGIHEHDPDIMHGLAQSEYGLENYSETKSILDKLIEYNPDYRNQEAHLLYAKSLERLGDTQKALEEYEILDSYYLGPEPTYHFAMLLRNQGHEERANALLEKIIKKSDLSGGHYNQLHKAWIKLAKEAQNK